MPPVGPYSPIVRAGDWLVVSGQIGLDGAEMVKGGIKPEVTQSIANIAALLAGEGARLANVVKTTVFLQSMADFAAMNAVYARHFPEPFPARSTVEVGALPKGALVEIECVALLRPMSGHSTDTY